MFRTDLAALTAGGARQSIQEKGPTMKIPTAAAVSAFRLVMITASLLVVSVACRAQGQPNTAPASPVPPAITNARAVFLANGGADGGLFPEPFSGDPNRGYFTLYSQLKSAGKYDLVGDPSQADLVMEISLAAPT